MSSLAIKFTSLAIRTLAKPIANQIKQQAHEHARFRQFCINLAQVIHRTDMRIRLGLLRDTSAIQQAELAAEHAKPKSSIAKEAKEAKEAREAAAAKESGPKSSSPEAAKESTTRTNTASITSTAATKKDGTSSPSSKTATGPGKTEGSASASHSHSHFSSSSSSSSSTTKKKATPPPPHIRPLSDVKALERGANFISEAFLFAVAGGLILFEAIRSRMKESARRDMVQERLQHLEEVDEIWRRKVEILERRLDQAGIKDVSQLTDRSSQTPPPKRIWDESGGWFGRRWKQATKGAKAEAAAAAASETTNATTQTANTAGTTMAADAAQSRTETGVAEVPQTMTTTKVIPQPKGKSA